MAESVECAICFDKLEDTSKVKLKSNCGHWKFHEKCISIWYKRSGSRKCPICKQSCAKETEYILSKKSANKIHKMVWNDWGGIKMCCPSHFFVSSGAKKYLQREFKSHVGLILQAVRTRKPVSIVVIRDDKRFTIKLCVSIQNRKLKLKIFDVKFCQLKKEDVNISVKVDI